MLEYDDFDFQEHMEEEREISQQQKPSPQGNNVSHWGRCSLATFSDNGDTFLIVPSVTGVF